MAQYPTPGDQTKAEAKAEKKHVEAPSEQTLAEKVKVAQEEIDKAVKAASGKTDDEGRVIGLDGENPVSNENPDPRAVRGVRIS